MIFKQLRKKLYRVVRYNPIVEVVQNKLRRSALLQLSEISMQLEVSPGEIIIDGGANIGDLASRFARTGAVVYAFEPNPSVFEILSRRFKYLSNVKCLNEGLMDKACKLELEVPEAHEHWDSVETSVSGSFMREDRFAAPTKKFDVTCVDIVNFINHLDSPVRLLKLDIEGAEIPVLNSIIDSGVSEKIGFIVVETHEEIMPNLLEGTKQIRSKIIKNGLEHAINLNWP